MNMRNQISKLIAAAAISALVGCGGVEGEEAETEDALTYTDRTITFDPTLGDGTYCLIGDEDCLSGGGGGTLGEGGGSGGGTFVCGAAPDANGYTTCTTATYGPSPGTCVVVTEQCHHQNGTKTCHSTPPQTVYAHDCDALNR